jgi:hypothetical protein
MPSRCSEQTKSRNVAGLEKQRRDGAVNTVQQYLESTAAREDTARLTRLQVLFATYGAG